MLNARIKYAYGKDSAESTIGAESNSVIEDDNVSSYTPIHDHSRDGGQSGITKLSNKSIA
jgi:hypothetical protein